MSRREGWLVKQGGAIKTWKKRWCVLINELNVASPDKPLWALKYYKSNDRAECMGTISLSDVKSVGRGDAETKRPYCIALTTPGRTYMLLAANERELTSWTEAFAACLKELNPSATVDLTAAGLGHDTAVAGSSANNDDLFNPPAASSSSSISATAATSPSAAMSTAAATGTFSSSSASTTSSSSSGSTPLPPLDTALIKGWLQKKKDGKNWKRRWCVLFPRKLAYFKSDATYAEPLGVISLDKTQSLFEDADRETKRPHAFKVTSGDTTYFFTADTVHDRDLWLSLLNGMFEDDVPRGDGGLMRTGSRGAGGGGISRPGASPATALGANGSAHVPSSSALLGLDAFGALYPARCSAAGQGIQQGYVGEPSVFTITARDANGYVRVGRSDPFVIKVNGPYGSRPPEPRIKNNCDGTYLVTYVCEEEGDYVVAVTVDGQHIVDSPFYAPHDYRINTGQAVPTNAPPASVPSASPSTNSSVSNTDSRRSRGSGSFSSTPATLNRESHAHSSSSSLSSSEDDSRRRPSGDNAAAAVQKDFLDFLSK
ncbi:hypothetical protein CAOG_06731 [Capsaspora owczarzaki ATCC 30864]|uniref:PH domain-containing protein n=1 Tax=Capsaspora owczarzaki (strain ATCC 30864) TaxID=595528 RepID=A0A0D2X4P1_CAPO3|nr:hypothetical protein CAOG_06731 [Capsaspora owczarzaki ATCC 30864]KJE96399.1 hypothetical protein CAOG_006731 [Capsaspora owczarzaki ATCC 30864]|eukprot:XP_004344352.1 hypothetical protein CAOG_06731 [Capsaspora owczarzaki ATCC 30864]